MLINLKFQHLLVCLLYYQLFLLNFPLNLNILGYLSMGINLKTKFYFYEHLF